MGRIYTASRFILHLLRARRWDSFHSPYLFNLFTACCDDKKAEASFLEIESKRKEWLSSNEIFLRKDFGAGSVYQLKQENVRISHIALHSLSLPFQCRFMSRLASYTNAGHIVELGTSLGIATAYLSAGAPTGTIDTVEGDPQIAHRAQAMLDALKLKNVIVHLATFNAYSSQYRESYGKIDMLFLDGDHRIDATLHHFQALKPFFHSGSIVIVDDIYWSQDMNTCWKNLTTLPEVTQSVDCFYFGLLFFNADFLSKELHQVRLPLRMILK